MTAATTITIERDPEEVVCVGRRVDWLTIAFRVRFDKAVLRSFVTTEDEKPPKDAPFAVRAYLAKKHRVASVRLELPGATPDEDPADFRMKMIGEGKTILENGSCVVTLHENAPKSPDDNPDEPGWTLAVQWSGVGLIYTTYIEAAEQSFRIAQALGEVLAVRMRRLDLAADMAGFQIPGDPMHGWCTRPQLRSRKMREAKRLPVSSKVRRERAKSGRKLLQRYEDGEIEYDVLAAQFPDIDETFYFPEGHCTGWRFGKGVINARVYDKPAEMRMRVARTSRADKRKEEGDKANAERRWWTSNGWDGQGGVARCEVECRGEFLHELDIRLPDPPVDVDGVCTACDKRHEHGCPRTYATARCDLRRQPGQPVTEMCAEFLYRMGYALDAVWRYFTGSPEFEARKDPLPVDEHGKCVRCKVRHAVPESCRWTAAPKSGWLRQIVLDTGRPRSECEATPAWVQVQRVVFRDRVLSVPQRTRKRGAMRATQALGSALALLGYDEVLGHPNLLLLRGYALSMGIPTHDPLTGEVVQIVDGEDDWAKRMCAPKPIEPTDDVLERKRREELAEAQARERGNEMVDAVCVDIGQQMGREIAEVLKHIYEGVPHEALTFLWTRQNAARARWKPLAKTKDPRLPANDTARTA